MYGTPSKAAAEEYATELNRLDRFYDPSRPTVRYVVAPYATNELSQPLQWGVIRKWRYADRPELGEFGGAFVFMKRRGL